MSGAARELARAGMVVTGALFVSRILGWVRVAVIAASLGISRELDIYTAAFRIPDFIFQLVAAGALASAVIPTIAALVATGERDAGLASRLHDRHPAHGGAGGPRDRDVHRRARPWRRSSPRGSTRPTSRSSSS